MAEQSNLLRFGFVRKQKEKEQGRPNSMEDRPSTSSSVQVPATRRQRSTSQGDKATESAVKKKKDGPREVRLESMKRWQTEKGDDDWRAGKKSQHPDLTWLRYETVGNIVAKVWCFYCRRKPEIIRQCNEAAGLKHDTQAYVHGTANVKKTNTIRHANSKGHRSTHAACIAEDTAPAERPLERIVLRMHHNVFDRLVRLYQIAYFIAKEEQPFTNMSKIVALEKLHGVDLGSAYASQWSAQKFTRYIAQVLREPLQHHLKSSTYCYHSLFTDGTTDKSTSEREVVYVKIFQDGEAHMKMMGLIDVEHANATAVKEALLNFYKDFLALGEDELDFAVTGCIGAGADGASVNFGVHRGMMAQLRNEMPWLVAVHCVAHRLELAVKDSFKNSYFTDQIQPVLLKVFSFYSRSPKRYRELKAVAAMKHVKVITLKRAEGTRWVAHRLKAMEAFLHNYSCLITHWEDVSNPARKDVKDADKATIKGFLARLKKTKFMALLAFYMDLLAAVSAISMVFQRNDLSLQEVTEAVKFHLASLQHMHTHDGPVSGVMVDQFREEMEEVEEGSIYRGVNMKGSMDDTEACLAAERDTTIASVVEKLEGRFEDFTTDPILSSCEVFDHKIWPEDDTKLGAYGVEEIGRLLDNFKIPLERHGVDLVAAKREWGQMKAHIAKHYQGVAHRMMWKAIFKKKSETFPNLLHLVAIVMVLPISNAQLERAFSAMGRVLTDWRRSLKTSIISDLMLITLEGPATGEFDAKAGVSKWLLDVGPGNIRPNRKAKGKKKSAGDNDQEKPEETMELEVEGAGDDDKEGPEETMELDDEESGADFEDFGMLELDTEIEVESLESDNEESEINDGDDADIRDLGLVGATASDDVDEQMIIIE